MIGYLSGKIIDINKSDLTLLTNNSVGYKINIASNLKFLIDQEASFYIYTSVKETEISLWGFTSKNDLDLFEYLISVSGVGTKTAMSLIDLKGFELIVQSIISGNYDELKVSGVGPKTAQKIVIELKTKLAKFAEGMSMLNNQIVNNNKKINLFLDDAIEALTSLGYREQDIRSAYNKLDEIQLESANDSPSLVKLLLKVI